MVESVCMCCAVEVVLFVNHQLDTVICAVCVAHIGAVSFFVINLCWALSIVHIPHVCSLGCLGKYIGRMWVA